MLKGEKGMPMLNTLALFCAMAGALIRPTLKVQAPSTLASKAWRRLRFIFFIRVS